MKSNYIKFGVFLPTGYGRNVTYGFNLDVTLTAEKLGLNSAWACDHLYGGVPLIGKKIKRTSDILECWTAISALAPQTKELIFGTQVVAIPYRNPVVLAKIATTFDVITNGRLILGVGMGRSKDEFLGAGIPWESFDVRLERTRETIEIFKLLCINPVVNYEGKHYKLVKCQLWPKPVQKPHPPIWLGGFGPKFMTLLEYADGWLPPSLTIDEYKKRIPVVKEIIKKRGKPIEMAVEFYTSIAPTYDLALKNCEESIREFTGKDPETVAKHGATVQFGKKGASVKFGAAIGAPDECISSIEEYIKLGVRHFILNFFPKTATIEGLKLYAERVIPYIKGTYA